MHKTRTALAVAAMVVLAGACNGGGGDGGAPPPGLGAPAPLSIVVIGDSIASGEGINYGYTYDYNAYFNRLSTWKGGTTNPQWQGTYQLCHDSDQAYGDVLAPLVGATLAKFACTGSTYQNGIAYDRRYAGAFYRPAQFGDWLAGTNLNADYDAAKPDVVIVTFGADDVSFADILTFCNTGYTLADAAEVDALLRAPDRSRAIREAFLRKYPSVDALAKRAQRAAADSSSYCVAGSPGGAIQTLFWDPVQSGQIAGNYKALVAAIKARGEKAGKVPKIVFTTYHQPLPSPAQDINCYDLGALTRDEINYLITLEQTMQQTLVAAVSGIDGVAIADISGVVAGHELCTSDPWTYGITILLNIDKDSLAPFHPTPAGQAAIAAVVKQQLPTRQGGGGT